ncbi:hypothetical protein KUCAC02_034305 [Chaenocephalus aceratus]|nr:hypothetical protein KUCAC02_034305 [Chaenocephalus aceratus]
MGHAISRVTPSVFHANFSLVIKKGSTKCITQAGQHHEDHLEVGKLHHLSDEAGQAVVYVRVLAQEPCQTANVVF